LRLSRYFNNSPQFWLGLQMDYELDVARDNMEEKVINEIMPRRGLRTVEKAARDVLKWRFYAYPSPC
jgi:plasmid maintenance system antidote protein VapI